MPQGFIGRDTAFDRGEVQQHRRVYSERERERERQIEIYIRSAAASFESRVNYRNCVADPGNFNEHVQSRRLAVLARSY